MFEIIKSDLAGRIGKLQTNHGVVETPAYVPVIHPVKQSIPAQKLRKMGFDLVITNAYITKNFYGKKAIEQGIHKIIDFDASVMTDSGGFQVLEYGGVDVTPSEMAEFEAGILTDIAIPLDKPTGYRLPKAKAKAYVEHTLKVSKKTLDQSKQNGQIWVGPIQGGEHFDLVKKSTRDLVKFGFPMLALGSPVEFMESYEYRLLAKMILAAKKEIPPSIPLHLFGAGHPLTISFAVALGCDTFDSASYMLYAKKDRYITEDKTAHLSDIKYFSCNCEICSNFSPKELLSFEKDERTDKIALHNLYAIKSEVDRVKESINEGRLWEYVMKKIRAHPKLFEIKEVFTKNTNFFIDSTPKFKDKAIFLYSHEDQFRPEVISFHNLVRKFKTRKKNLVIFGETSIKPAYLSPEYQNFRENFDIKSVQFCQYNPFLGLLPVEISDIYPAAHYLMTDFAFDPKNFPEFLKTWVIFFKKNNFNVIHFDKKDEFLKFFVKEIPGKIQKKSLKK